MTIRNTISAALLACTALSAQAGVMPASTGPGPAPTPSSDFWSGSVTIGYDTDYIFRGVEVSEDNFNAALDLNFALNDRWTLNLNAWYTTSTTEVTGPGIEYDELNLYGRLFYKVNDQFSFGPSLRYYTYPSVPGAEDEIEAGLEFAYAPCANSSVTFGAFYNDDLDTIYLELGASYTFKLTDRISLVPGAVISYRDVDDTPVSDFNHASVYVKLPITLKDNVVLTPYVAGNFPLDAVDDLTNPDQDDEIYGGVSLTVGF